MSIKDDLCVVKVPKIELYFAESLYGYELKAENKIKLIEEKHKDLLQKYKINSEIWDTTKDKYWEKMYQSEEKQHFEVMTYGEYLARKRKKYLSRNLKEISEDKWWEMLEVMPPRQQMIIDGVELFCLQEMTDGEYIEQYARVGDKYYTKTVDLTDKNTWIHNILKRRKKQQIIKQEIKVFKAS